MNTGPDAGSDAQIFDRYADWYDAFYANKDYAAEVAYVLDKVRRFAAPTSWVDIGCGTGRHLGHLVSKCADIQGFDASAAMIARARERHPGLTLGVSRAQSVTVSRPADVVSMLFHVINYQASNSEITDALRGVARCLKPGGLFVFDFWNAEALAQDPPTHRLRSVEIDGRALYRTSIPLAEPDGVIAVKYEFRWDLPEAPAVYEETHRVRPYSEIELTRCLGDAGFEVRLCEGWMSDQPLTSHDWYGVICAQRTVGA